MREGTAPLIRRQDYTPPAFWISQVELTFDLEPAKTMVINRMRMRRNPDAAADSLLMMRVDALGDSPQLASALDDAARVLRRHDNAAIPLAWARVRRTLGGAPESRAGVAPWLGAP